MPVRQNCPNCGESFMGSDAIGGLCTKCELEKDGIHIRGCQMCQSRGWVIDTEKSQNSE